MIRIDILTTFPEMFAGPFDESMLKRAVEAGHAIIAVHNLRDWTCDVHHKTDDAPFGGGDGMVMMAPPIIEAVEDLKSRFGSDETRVVLLCPQGRTLNQNRVEELAASHHLILICGHYKGVDERVREILRPEEVSIGDYVLTGGEIPAMVIVDATVRLQEGVVGGMDSVLTDSFTSGLLDCPRYTRPREVRGHEVPAVLLSGNHADIDRWRQETALEKTKRLRPDLLEGD